jgi:hypothetical protein
MVEYFLCLIVFGAILTYLVWGFIITFESMLALNDTKSAIKWIRDNHKPKTFKRMLIIFLPMLHIGYVFLEVIPYLMGNNEKLKSFDLENIYKKIFPKNSGKK